MRVRFLADDVDLKEPGRGTMHNIRTLHFYEGLSRVEIGIDRTQLLLLKKKIDDELEATTE